MHSSDLKVVDISPQENLMIGSLTERIEFVINEYIGEGKITLSEVVGCLEIIKHKMIEDVYNGE